MPYMSAFEDSVIVNCKPSPIMKIAVEGCAHGELDMIYDTIERIQLENDIKVDLLLCCGDFQSVRNRGDLICMAVPQKYQKMCSFYKYYSGEKKAPLLTIFIGGNHEASNYLGELAYGGWVCPNIYYLGYAGVVKFGGLRIAGLSGIFKGHDFLRGHHEAPPYNNDSKRSAYHIRNIDIFRLKQISSPVDVCLSHDWPRGVYHYGNLDGLLRRKPFLRQDIERERLGSGPTRELLNSLRPSYWFAAHLHVKFAALICHDETGSDSDKAVTKFLALDKCLPRRDYLQVIDFEPKDVSPDKCLCYDEEWLCILKSTNHMLSVSSGIQYLPGPGGERCQFRPTEAELAEVRSLFNDDFHIPHNFERTAEAYDPRVYTPARPPQPKLQINPQTTELCQKLGISDPFQLILNKMSGSRSISINDFRSRDSSTASLNLSVNPDEVILDSDDDDAGFSEMPSTDVSGIANRTMDDGPHEASNSCTEEGCVATPRQLTTATPQRLKLILPPPTSRGSALPEADAALRHPEKESTLESDGKVESTAAGNPAVKEGNGEECVADAESVSTNKSVSVDPTDMKLTPPIKKFKRRNESIYATDDSEVF